ncbi:hypothetical protein ACWGQ4_05635 [Streptomyces sp. NPDC055721]|uniref:hypothetical protein n=1 Tax=Streptomyces sp. NPDC127132 TaxID=3345374 RepID=UPI00363FEF41
MTTHSTGGLPMTVPAPYVLAALLKHLESEGVTLFELHAGADAAPLYEEFGFGSDPALMRMTRIQQAEGTAR